MYTITKQCLLLFTLFISMTVMGQEVAKDSTNKSVNELKIENLKKKKERIEEEEKAFLKSEIEGINKRLDKGEITPAKAEELKREVAKNRALNIQNRTAIIDNQIALLERNQSIVDDDSDDQMIIRIGKGGENATSESIIYMGQKRFDKPRKYDRRTTSDVVFGIGFNNAIIEGESLDDSPYKLGGSGFVELGYAWKTRVFNNSNFLRIKYGFSFQWNKLNIKDNQYLVRTNDQIVLEEFPQNLNKAKFRMTNLVFPVHFEFGPSKKIDRGSYVRYSTRHQVKFGIGAYGGFNLAVMQKLKYENENGNNTKDKIRSGYNTSDLIYGLSGYIALGDVAIYCKYDLNPIFKDQTIAQNNISLGLRFDMD